MVPVSASAAWRPGFGSVLAAVSMTVLAGSHYESGKLVPATAKMAPVTPRTDSYRDIKLDTRNEDYSSYSVLIWGPNMGPRWGFLEEVPAVPLRRGCPPQTC